MSASYVLLACGLLAMTSGACLAEGICGILERRAVAASMLASTPRERAVLKLKGGVRPLLNLSGKAIAAFPFVGDTCQSACILAQDRGMDVSKEALLSLLLAATLATAVLGVLLGGSVVFGLAAGCIVFAGSAAYVRNKGEKRDLAMREEIPDVLRALSMSFRSGHSLSQTLSEASKETSGHLSRMLSSAADRLDMGATTTEALSAMRNNARLPELSFVAVALDVQHRSGGSIAPVLESATESIEGELKLMRSLRVQTAQAKLSASIVTVMPFILVALFSLMSPDFLSPFFSSVLGMAVLALALMMQLAGVLIVRRMLKVEVA